MGHMRILLSEETMACDKLDKPIDAAFFPYLSRAFQCWGEQGMKQQEKSNKICI